MLITEFGPNRDGPESALVSAVLGWSENPHNLTYNGNSWTALEPTIGAGMPDVVMTSYRPQIDRAGSLDSAHATVLSYLRNISGARLSTIADRTSADKETVGQTVRDLKTAGAVAHRKNAVRIDPLWRAILPETVAIEAKVSDWKKAFRQADRNRVFAHYTYVALPANIARRARAYEHARSTGIGIISVETSAKVTLLRHARRSSPSVWTYYYGLAFMLARAVR